MAAPSQGCVRMGEAYQVASLPHVQCAGSECTCNDRSTLVSTDEVVALFAEERAAAEAWAKRMGGMVGKRRRDAEHERIVAQAAGDSSRKKRHLYESEIENCDAQTAEAKPLEQVQQTVDTSKPLEQVTQPASPTPAEEMPTGILADVDDDDCSDDSAEICAECEDRHCETFARPTAKGGTYALLADTHGAALVECSDDSSDEGSSDDGDALVGAAHFLGRADGVLRVFAVGGA